MAFLPWLHFSAPVSAPSSGANSLGQLPRGGPALVNNGFEHHVDRAAVVTARAVCMAYSVSLTSCTAKGVEGKKTLNTVQAPTHMLPYLIFLSAKTQIFDPLRQRYNSEMV